MYNIEVRDMGNLVRILIDCHSAEAAQRLRRRLSKAAIRRLLVELEEPPKTL
jgi:hypothetical protein